MITRKQSNITLKAESQLNYHVQKKIVRMSSNRPWSGKVHQLELHGYMPSLQVCLLRYKLYYQSVRLHEGYAESAIL